MRSRDVASAAAFAALYERHHRDLYRYCRSILRDDHDAQDALQSTMTRAFAALRGERRDFELRPWLFRIAHNEAVSLLRRRRPAEPLDEHEAGGGPLDEQVELRRELDVLRGDLGALPERQRAALVLRELSGLSHVEIAQALDATPQIVKQLIFQARTALTQAREGREMECADVRRTLSDGDGRVLRGTGIRAHLRCCASCRMFREDLERRPQALAQLAPPLSPAAGAALLEQLLPAAASVGGTASATAGTIAALGPKVAATLAVVVTAAAGGGAVARDRRAPELPATIAVAAPATPARDAATPSEEPARVTTGASTGAVARGSPDGPPESRTTHGRPPWAATERRAERRGTENEAKPNHGNGRPAGAGSHRDSGWGSAARPSHREGRASRGKGRATAGQPSHGNGPATAAESSSRHGRATEARSSHSSGHANAAGPANATRSAGGSGGAAARGNGRARTGAPATTARPSGGRGRVASGHAGVSAALRPAATDATARVREPRSDDPVAAASASPPAGAGPKFGARS